MVLKKCVICGCEFEARSNKKYCSDNCRKEARKQIDKKYYNNHSELRKEYQRQYRKKNKENIKKYTKQYNKKNKEKRKEWEIKNKDKRIKQIKENNYNKIQNLIKKYGKDINKIKKEFGKTISLFTREIECQCLLNQSYIKMVDTVLNCAGNKSELSGEHSNKLIVHHLNNYHDFIEERANPLNCIALTIEEHILFHKKYGTKTTAKQFKKFVKEYNKPALIQTKLI